MPIPDSFLGKLKLPVVAAPMFLVSGPRMLIENCKNGVVGTLPALNQRSSEGFEQWLMEITQSLSEFEATSGKAPAPFGVNLIVHDTNPRLQADLELCVKYKVPLIVTSLGAVPELVDTVHSYGGLVFHDVTTRRHAEKAAEAGVDGLIAVPAGAGGHAGTLNPFALIQEIRSFFDKTLLLAGCMDSGSDIAAALQMGADMAYMGTRFINTEESQAVPEYKQMVIDCGSDDIIYTAAVSGVPASFMAPSMKENGYDLALLRSPDKVDYGEKLKPASDEAKAWKTVWSAGQGCAGIKDVVPVGKLIQRMHDEFTQAIKTQSALLDVYK